MSAAAPTRDAPGGRRAHQALRTLARLHGVQVHYLGTDGHRRYASDDALVAVLGALGRPLDRIDDAVGALRQEQSARWQRPLEPVIVHRPGPGHRTELSLPSEVDPEDVWITLRLEDGTEQRRRLAAFAGRRTAIASFDGTSRTRHRIALGGAQLPPGYHGVELEAPGLGARATVVAAPARCPHPDRSWGGFIPLHALRRGTDDWGAGSFADLAALGRWVADRGGGFVGTLPVLAGSPGADAGDPSPYLPASRLAWNELYVEVESIPELASADRWAAEARRALASGRTGRNDAGRHRGRVEAGVVLARKRPVLELLATSLGEGDAGRRSAFDDFVSRSPELRAYARFRAASERLGGDWRRWPGVTPGSLPDVAGDDRATRYHLYVQWVADQQLAEAARHGLYLDLPVGVHPSGFDTWQFTDSFAPGVSGGAPPDDFFAGGQTWGFLPLHPERIRHDGYRYLRAVLRHAMHHAAMVRIDHAMGLHRLYWVPDGFDARHGVYVRYRAEELHAVVALEATRAGTAVAGEDLGTVPGGVRRAMARDGMLSSFVLQFESTADDPLPTPGEGELASLGTHDLPTFAAYWGGLDIEERRRRGMLDELEASELADERARWRRALYDAVAGVDGSDSGESRAHEGSAPDADVAGAARAALRGSLLHLAAGPAVAVLVDLEDLWLEPDQQNRPGTGPGEGNFTRRAARTLEEITTDEDVAAIADALTRARTRAHDTTRHALDDEVTDPHRDGRHPDEPTTPGRPGGKP